MDIKAIATGVLATNHWPAHLGLTTDAEKIEWLARQLEAAADEAVEVEQLENRIARVDEECGALRDELAEFGEVKKCEVCKLCVEHK